MVDAQLKGVGVSRVGSNPARFTFNGFKTTKYVHTTIKNEG